MGGVLSRHLEKTRRDRCIGYRHVIRQDIARGRIAFYNDTSVVDGNAIEHVILRLLVLIQVVVLHKLGQSCQFLLLLLLQRR